MSKSRHIGGCLCGDVAFVIDATLSGVVACHCSQCRITHGTFGPYVEADLDDFTMTEEKGLAWYRASDFARRGFCKTCGTTLFWRRDDAPRISISAGTLETPTGLKILGHIFVDDKTDFLDLTDGTPVFAQSDGRTLRNA